MRVVYELPRVLQRRLRVIPTAVRVHYEFTTSLADFTTSGADLAKSVAELLPSSSEWSRCMHELRRLLPSRHESPRVCTNTHEVLTTLLRVRHEFATSILSPLHN